jgi:uncharacterized protein (TIGR03435 family)
MRPKRIWSATLLLIGMMAANAFSQQTFDVISIKPTQPGKNLSQSGWTPGRLFNYGATLKQLIEWAYQVTSIQIEGGPDWMQSKMFDFEGKAERGGTTRDELLLLLQPALADRFKVALHREQKERPVYVLTTGGVHPELHDAKGGPKNIQFQGGTPVPGGYLVQVVGQSVSMGYLAGYLTSTQGRMVVDHSGLNDSYDFKVEVQIDAADAADQRSGIAAALWNAVPKLGLKLDPQKQMIDILVIDHAEEPSAN